MVRSAGEFSTATRMRAIHGASNQPANVWYSSQTFSAAMITATTQARPRIQTRRHERAHLAPVAGEADERKHRERELQAQDHLAQDEQRPGAPLAVEDHDDHGRHDGHQPRDQPPQPRPQADVDEPFHHDLPGQRAGERGVLAGEEQRDGEQRARGAGAEQRRQQLVGVGDVGHLLVAGAVEHRRRHDEDRRVDEERRHQRDRRVDRREPDRLELARLRVEVLARLHDRRVQIQVVRHHRRAQDADRDVEHLGIAQDLRCAE